MSRVVPCPDLVDPCRAKYFCGLAVPGTKILVPRCWYQDLGTRILVPSSWYQDLGTKILVPGSWYQDLGTKILVQDLGAKILVPKKTESLRGGASQKLSRGARGAAGSPPGGPPRNSRGSGAPVQTILWIQNHLLTTFRPSAKHRQPLPFLGERVKPIHLLSDKVFERPG